MKISSFKSLAEYRRYGLRLTQQELADKEAKPITQCLLSKLERGIRPPKKHIDAYIKAYRLKPTQFWTLFSGGDHETTTAH